MWPSKFCLCRSGHCLTSRYNHDWQPTKEGLFCDAPARPEDACTEAGQALGVHTNRGGIIDSTATEVKDGEPDKPPGCLFDTRNAGDSSNQIFILQWNPNMDSTESCSHEQKCICMLRAPRCPNTHGLVANPYSCTCNHTACRKGFNPFALRATATAGSFPRAPTRMAWF